MKIWTAFIRPVLSEADNRTLSFVRIGAVLFGTTAIVLSCVSVARGNPFDASGFLMGAAALLGGAGVGVRFGEGTKHDESVG